MYKFGLRRRTLDVRSSVSPAEKRFLVIRAKEAKMSVSQYIRQLVLDQKLKDPPTLPAEVLAFKGQLYQLCGTLQPFSLKHLDNKEWNALDRAEAKHLIRSIEEVIGQLKNQLK
jgi:hypothetical protein